MTPAQSTSRTTVTVRSNETSRTPRCEHTLLTKPECHCPACLAAQIAAHGPMAAST
jgi:hypothetical protein